MGCCITNGVVMSPRENSKYSLLVSCPDHFRYFRKGFGARDYFTVAMNGHKLTRADIHIKSVWL